MVRVGLSEGGRGRGKEARVGGKERGKGRQARK